MATKGTISSLPVVDHSIVDCKALKKYKVERDPFTNIANPEMNPFDIELGEFLFIQSVCSTIISSNIVQHLQQDLNVSKSNRTYLSHLKYITCSLSFLFLVRSQK